MSFTTSTISIRPSENKQCLMIISRQRAHHNHRQWWWQTVLEWPAAHLCVCWRSVCVRSSCGASCWCRRLLSLQSFTLRMRKSVSQHPDTNLEHTQVTTQMKYNEIKYIFIYMCVPGRSRRAGSWARCPSCPVTPVCWSNGWVSPSALSSERTPRRYADARSTCAGSSPSPPGPVDARERQDITHRRRYKCVWRWRDLQRERRRAVSLWRPALHQTLDVPGADEAQTGLQTAFLCAFSLQTSAQSI